MEDFIIIYRNENDGSDCFVYAPNIVGNEKELLGVEKRLIEQGIVIAKVEVPYIQCIDTNYKGDSNEKIN